jgi:hypothetical protein
MDRTLPIRACEVSVNYTPSRAGNPGRKDREMKTAKCYLKQGWWMYYRTEDGHTFSVRDGKDYWYSGNVYKGEKLCVYVKPEQHAELFSRIKFEM